MHNEHFKENILPKNTSKKMPLLFQIIIVLHDELQDFNF